MHETKLVHSYLARAESRGNQGGHDDHGDYNLDGGGNVRHIDCLGVSC
jgi:hypothetical protein